VGDRFGETGALNGVGEASLAVGQPEDARARHADALTLAEQIGDRYEQARAHEGLGHSHHALGQPAEASQHWQQALAVYTEIGVPQSEPVRGRLASRTARATD
jgi:tetratricopeptide (TPR) repeat protein